MEYIVVSTCIFWLRVVSAQEGEIESGAVMYLVYGYVVCGIWYMVMWYMGIWLYGYMVYGYMGIWYADTSTDL